MKYIRTYESFKNKKSDKQVEPVNEEIFGFIGNLFSKLFSSIKRVVNKVKGGNEVEEIYDEYLQKITDALKKQVNVELNLAAAGNPDEAKPTAKPEENKKLPTNEATTAEKLGGQKPGEQPKEEEEPEGDENTTDNKQPGGDDKNLDPKILVQKKELIDQIVIKLKDEAIEKMNGVLSNAGGAEENPGLASLIKNKKSEFELAFLNAKVQFLTDAGDTTMIAQIKKERDAKKSEVEKGYKELAAEVGANNPKVELKIGSEYIYTNKKGEKKDVKLVSIESKMKIGGDKEWATKDDEKVEDLADENAFVVFKNKNGEYENDSPTVAVLKSKLELKKEEGK
jgi:hypothetical protein